MALDEKKMNYLDALIIFFSIMFKYLINYKVSMKFLYCFLLMICILTIINIYYKKFTKNEFIKIIVFFAISIYFIVVYKDVNFFISFLLALICIRKENREFIKIFFISSIILYLFTIILNTLGILESKNMIRITEGVISYRKSLGFTHPNEVFLYFMPIALAGYYLYGNKKIYYLVLIISSTILYKLSYCRTGYVTIISLIFINLIKNILIRFRLKDILPYLMLLFTVVSILLAIYYGYSLDNTISQMLSGRPYYWNYYIEKGSLLSIIGKNEIVGYYLDSFYIFLLVELGIIGYLIYYMIYYKSLKLLREDTKLMLIILVFFIYGLTETNVIIGSIQFAFAIQIKSIIIKNKNLNKGVFRYGKKISICNSTSL